MHRELLLAVLLLFVNDPIPAATPDSTTADISSRVDISLTLTGKDSDWNLTGDFVYSRYCHSGDTIQVAPFVVIEPDHAPISWIKVTYDGLPVIGNVVGTVPLMGIGEYLPSVQVHVVSPGRDFKPGDSVSCSYRQRFRDPFFAPALPVENDYQIDSYTVTFRHPPNVSVDFEAGYARDSFPYTVDHPDDTTTQLTIGTVAKQSSLPYFGLNQMHGLIVPILRVGTRPLNPFSVPDFVRAYLSRIPFDRTYDRPLPPTLADHLNESTTVRAKLAAIHHYVCSSLRYLSDNRRTSGIFPHDPDEVDSLGYGDCKDRAGLVVALARKVGIDSVYMALVATTAQTPLSGVHAGQFDHEICVWRHDDSLLFFDPTAPYYRFGDLPGMLLGRPAVVLDSLAPQRVVIDQTPTEPMIECEITGDVDSLSTAGAKLTIRYDLASEVRHGRIALDAVLRDDSLRTELTRCFPSIRLADLKVVDTSDGSIRLEGRADLTRFIIESPSKRYIPRAPFGEVPIDVLRRGDDSLPIDYGGWLNAVLRIRLKTTTAVAATDSTAFGEPRTGQFSAHFASDGAGGIDLSYHLVRQESVLGGRDKQRHLEFVKRYLDEKAHMYILKREQQ